MTGTFTVTITKQTVEGDRKVAYGTFVAASSNTGGEVITGLGVVETFSIQETGAAVIASRSTANESFPLVGGSVTVVVVADTSGLWKAVGY